MSIRVEYSDFHIDEYDTKEEAKHAILEAHAEGVSVDDILDTITYKPLSLIWDVELQEKN